jgi:hypothetical protein
MQKVVGSNPISRFRDQGRSTSSRRPPARSGSRWRGDSASRGDGWPNRSEQAWFWTREWQQREHEADRDLAAGKVTKFESDDDFLAALDERTKPLDADA